MYIIWGQFQLCVYRPTELDQVIIPLSSQFLSCKMGLRSLGPCETSLLTNSWHPRRHRVGSHLVGVAALGSV